MAAYTQAKTAFVQDLVHHGHDRLGLPRVDVREAYPPDPMVLPFSKYSRRRHPTLAIGRAVPLAARDKKPKARRRSRYFCSTRRCSAIPTNRSGVGVAIPSPPS